MIHGSCTFSIVITTEKNENYQNKREFFFKGSTFLSFWVLWYLMQNNSPSKLWNRKRTEKVEWKSNNHKTESFQTAFRSFFHDSHLNCCYFLFSLLYLLFVSPFVSYSSGSLSNTREWKHNLKLIQIIKN